MKIEDRMSMWAAKRPRDEVAELLLEGAQEIADLRRHREEDGKQMGALISGYQKMQGLCIDGKYLTDDEKQAIEYYIGTGGPYSVDCTLIALLDRMRSGALTTCEMVSQNGDFPESENVAEQDNTPATHGTPSERSVQNRCTLTDAERDAIAYFASFHQSPREADATAAATLRGLLERL